MKIRLTWYLGAASAVAFLSPSAYAALTIANGDFETGGGDNIDNITGWHDYNSGNFWQGAWQTNSSWITPNGTSIAMLGSFDNSGSNNTTASANPLIGSYLYQSIGTADGATSATIGFDFGAPNDDGGGRTLGMTVAIYAYDGLGTFLAGDNVSIHAASQVVGSGVTLLDSDSGFTLVSTGVDGLISSYQSTLDLTAAGSQQLFLSFNNYRPANTESWSALDNISVVPEPSAALLGGIGLLGLLRRRR